MTLEQKSYSILIVNNNESFERIMKELLSPSNPTTYSHSITEAKRKFLEHTYDFVIINAPLADSTGTRFAIDCTKRQTTVVLYLTRKDTFDDLSEALIANGVFVLPKPITKITLEYAISWLASASQRLKAAHKKTTSLQDKMEEIKIVNRAKFLLISEQFMTESDAHHYIEKQAMDNCVSKKEISLAIIEKYKES